MKIKLVSTVFGSLLAAGVAIGAPKGDKPPRLEMKALTKAFSDLKDPGSLQVRNLVYKHKGDDAWIICGEFNAKNSYGGYVGFQRFSGVTGYLKDGKTAMYFIPAQGEVADKLCADEGL